MKRRRGLRFDLSMIAALALILLVFAVASSIEGGRATSLWQPTAALIVLGGTAAALFLSFPFPVVIRTGRGIVSVLRVTPEPERALVSKFEQYANRVIRKGTLAIESEISTTTDPFLKRALGMVADGTQGVTLRESLTTFSRAQEDGDEESALVLETAAGYAPTLGILGAVLGLIRVMENLGTPSAVGAGIAVAFVSTVYGVGLANLLLLPLASRVRSVSRTAALTRELIIEGAVILQGRVHPRLVDSYLSGFIRDRASDRTRGAA